jgi:hypothetical protein
MEGMLLVQTAPSTPEQNGIAERSGRVIWQRARAMRIEARLPPQLWPEIIRTAIYVMNRTPRKVLNWDTLLTKVMKSIGKNYKPNLANLKTLGCKAYVRKINLKKSQKLEPRAWIG